MILVPALFGMLYGALQIDQQISTVLVWPGEGARFVEVGDSARDRGYRDSMVIVAGGLNRKSGNLVGAALLPSVGGPDARVFSLIYGSGIFDDNVNAKFDELFRQYQPTRLVFVGSSMGGDVVLNIAAHFQQTFTDPESYPPGRIIPAIDGVYLDCSPMGTSDVRYEARTKADFLTGLTETLGTDGGAATRLIAEMLAQRKQWSVGNYPFLQVSLFDFEYKFKQVWREKLNTRGVSTALVKDQYGVIRRFDAERVLNGLPPGTDLVYLRPERAEDDNTIDVQRVEQRLRVLAVGADLDLSVILIPGGSHASAARDSSVYNPLISAHVQQVERDRVTKLVIEGAPRVPVRRQGWS